MPSASKLVSELKVGKPIKNKVLYFLVYISYAVLMLNLGCK